MSDTPRTDSAAKPTAETYDMDGREIIHVVPDYFARALERELNAAKAEIEAFKWDRNRIALTTNERDEARVALRRLESEIAQRKKDKIDC